MSEAKPCPWPVPPAKAGVAVSNAAPPMRSVRVMKRPFVQLRLESFCGFAVAHCQSGASRAKTLRHENEAEKMSEVLISTRESLKQVDPDRYRAALMADAQRRDDLLILYAFHYELSKVPDVTSEPMLGQIRYEWWREAIDEIYSGKEVRRHEITTPLAELLRRTDVPRFWIDRLIDGRARDLDPQPFEDLGSAQSYARQTSGQLMQIAVRLIGGETDKDAAKAGEVWGLTGLARSYSYYHDRILQNLSFEDLTAAAQQSYVEISGPVDSQIFPAMAYVSLVPKFLKRMSKGGFKPQKEKVVYGPISKQARLFSAGLRGRI